MTNRLAFAQLCSGLRRKGTVALCLALCMVALGLSASAREPRIITIDVAAAGGSPGQGTFASSINFCGAITGYYSDANYSIHGFVRAPGGAITTFDAPGTGTTPLSINFEGAITGGYVDASNVAHGFVRAPGGAITTIDVPGAGEGAFQGTSASSINFEGAITGNYIDANNVFHGFVRAPGGAIKTFDAPGAGSLRNTIPESISDGGVITGFYADANNTLHGFVRAPGGAITAFVAPGAGAGAFQGTVPVSINLDGTITGAYVDATGVHHGFVRAPDGAIKTFVAPGAGALPNSPEGTGPQSINSGGMSTGYDIDANDVAHGFVRAPGGAITTFNAPGAGAVTGSFEGTFASSINFGGAITGYDVDANGVTHGFLLVP